MTHPKQQPHPRVPPPLASCWSTCMREGAYSFPGSLFAKTTRRFECHHYVWTRVWAFERKSVTEVKYPTAAWLLRGSTSKFCLTSIPNSSSSSWVLPLPGGNNSLQIFPSYNIPAVVGHNLQTSISNSNGYYFIFNHIRWLNIYPGYFII